MKEYMKSVKINNVDGITWINLLDKIWLWKIF